MLSFLIEQKQESRENMESKKAELRQQIYNELKQKIISGAFVCNQRLVETQIAAQYGVNKANMSP